MCTATFWYLASLEHYRVQNLFLFFTSYLFEIYRRYKNIKGHKGSGVFQVLFKSY